MEKSSSSNVKGLTTEIYFPTNQKEKEKWKTTYEEEAAM
jgi:hypothetical protein